MHVATAYRVVPILFINTNHEQNIEVHAPENY